MTARMCQHNRQFAHCGDCWNNRCDICEATLDAANICLTHGQRLNPKGPLASPAWKDEGQEFHAHAHLVITIEKLVTAKTVEEAMADVQNEMLKYYPPHRQMPGHTSSIQIHAEPRKPE